ncbi:MAG: acyl-CoA thioesterase [Burkholderiales bacterium]|jgi:4-hydroxybenzoyl-CoA thioesterase|nr:acyl-CoA thioesterase [Burkholderiales bacterium]
MNRVHTYPMRVEFGDCDPAQIVWFPNYFRWADAASRHFFVQCGLPSWKVSEAERGIIGTPLVDTHARFLRPASYGDALQIDSFVPEWRRKSFVMRHSVRRGEDTLCEITEIRVFARRKGDGSDPHAIEAVPVPEDWRALCE